MSEDILLDKKVMWYKKKMQAFQGSLCITNTRLSFNQDRINAGGGLLGALVSSQMKKTRGGEILNEEIANLSFSKGKKMGRKSYILEVKTKDEQQFNFLVDDKIMENVKDVVKIEE